LPFQDIFIWFAAVAELIY